MLREQLAVLELLKNLIRGNTNNISRVTYSPQKPAFPGWDDPGWRFPRRTPESQGIASGYLADFIEELAGNERTDLHHVIVVRHGNVIAEMSVAPYVDGMWHASYSMCKTITGLAVGMLMEEGKLTPDDKVLALLDKKSLLTVKKNLTVEHLLTMTSGVMFNETGIVSGDDWVSSYLQAGIKGTPGKQFEYNSMNTYILSAIVTKVTGETLMEYLRPRLWEPLGITRVFWETCPKGITKGGWGLFINTEDAAKIGQLFLQKGMWQGKQLVPEKWILESVEKHMDTPENMGPYGYGYQVWRSGRPGSCTFNGMLGQNVVVYPDLDMVIATNAGSDELFQNCILLNIVRKYFEGDFVPDALLSENPSGYRKLLETERRFSRDGRSNISMSKGICRSNGLGIRESSRRGRQPASGGWGRRSRSGAAVRLLEEEKLKRRLDGKVYELEQQHVGLCPLVFQVFHNNYTDGIRRAAFYYERNRFYLVLEEGNELHRMEVGFGRAAVTEVSFHGEPYLLGVGGAFAKDEEGIPVLKLDIAFLEEAVRRRLKCRFPDFGERIELYWDETPGGRMITEGLGALVGDSLPTGLMEGISSRLGVDLPAILVEKTVHPIVTGKWLRENDGEAMAEQEAASEDSVISTDTASDPPRDSLQDE